MAGCSCCASFQAEALASVAGFWEMGEQHGCCRCEELREQDKLLQPHPPEAIARQRRRCRAWLDGELSWSEVLGER